MIDKLRDGFMIQTMSLKEGELNDRSLFKSLDQTVPDAIAFDYSLRGTNTLE